MSGWQSPPSHRTSPQDETESVAIGCDGTRLYVRRRPGPPEVQGRPTVLFCDGVLCDGFIWKYLWNDMAALGPVAHWHYRGHGRSALPADPERLEVVDFAADLDCVRRHLGDPEVVLVGHSFGVQVALEAYRLRPARVVGLVLCCGSYGRVTHTFHGTNVLARLMPPLLAWVTDHSKIARALWTRVPAELALQASFFMREVDVAHMRKEDLLPYLQHMTHVDFGLFVHVLRAAGEHSAEDLLEKIEIPTLVIAAERDTFTPPELARGMARSIPKGELLVLQHGSHAALIEQPDLVRQWVGDFVDRIAGVVDPDDHGDDMC